MKKVRRAKLVDIKPKNRAYIVSPIVDSPVMFPSNSRATRVVAWLRGGEVKQVEYTFVGLRKEIIFKLKDMKLSEIRKIVKALGIDWEPIEGDRDADYIKFIPRDGGTQ